MSHIKSTIHQLAELADISEELLQKALRTAEAGGNVEPSAYDLDPSNYAAYTSSDSYRGSEHEGTSQLDYDILTYMSRVPVVSSILQTRINQIAEFCIPQEDQFKAGYVIRLRDKSKEPTDEERKEMQALSNWIETCGEGYKFGGAWDFESFVRMITRDSLIYDQACFEIIKNRGGAIIGFIPVDASTIRRASVTEEEKKEGRRDWVDSAYIQVINGKRVATFDNDKLAFCIRRPRTNIASRGYGFPELEELVKVVTHLVNAETYNASNFTNGIHANSILAIKSKMNPQLFRAFKREFYANLSGPAQAKRTPIIQLDPESQEEIESVNLGATAEEMGYKDWLGYLTKVACSVYQIDPAELGFVFGTEGQTGALTQQGPGARIQASKDKGLYPLLRSVQNWINRHIIHQVNEKYELRFMGLDADTEKDALASDIQRVSNYMTINEIRAKHSLDKIEGGDVILNQAYITALGMSQQQAQEQGQGQQDEEDQSEDYGQEEEQEEGGETQDQENPGQEDNEGEEVTKSLSSYKFSIEI